MSAFRHDSNNLKNLWVSDLGLTIDGRYYPDHRNFIPVRELRSDHPAIQYLQTRKVPQNRFAELYYTDNFLAYAHQLHISGVADLDLFGLEQTPPKQDSRIVFLSKNQIGEVTTLSSRSILAKSTDMAIRYITLKVKSSVPCCFYGLDRVKVDSLVWVVEGPFDSLFLENAVALCGISKLCDGNIRNYFKNFVIVLDNEPANSWVLTEYRRRIANGDPIVIWPQHQREKDVNELAQAGWQPQQIQQLLRENTYVGGAAATKFQEWIKA